MEELEKENVQVIAASADTLEEAVKTVERYSLTFRIGYGLIPREVSELTGAFYNAKENYVHATGFLIGPDGTIKNAVYSSRSIGRLVAKDCLNFIKG
jgi:peroxiredoxin